MTTESSINTCAFTTYQPDTKIYNLHCNPNPTTKQHAMVSMQLSSHVSRVQRYLWETMSLHRFCNLSLSVLHVPQPSIIQRRWNILTTRLKTEAPKTSRRGNGDIRHRMLTWGLGSVAKLDFVRL